MLTNGNSMSEGLAEAFCLSDPSRHDCPILFASDGGYMLSLVVSYSCFTILLFYEGAKLTDTLPRIQQDDTLLCKASTCY